MKNDTINDFEIGDIVYHLSNGLLSMVVIEIVDDLLVCRLINVNGDSKINNFLPEELVKSSIDDI
ncbi:hypothetical protein [Tenacibaculum finnmarkense]|nr:hypothetical protein [Tenacibaculum finnmarkense]MCG8253186.1 hypothetical protein [Tenacibaculum finnmarkense genomovar finnmarkense]MCG8816689.1 hypothetical protein [Tenacibaculum finnmarkense]MCG8821696.1 hypothetical protein [Tenacibaculum finnmarkense]